ncbi:molybdopterin guanine dinucleotide-containing S/N-oxide reductase [Rhizobium oryzicola]|uniref:Molybdopterin guanine dinucleotide-containing S/N-oxide reductase n=1 Tax=Rhizobium oryzicola TaxID=1232668 RepID=A0ABT8SW03_9HYPH|nr:molybdopterin guanine dinucleotide-containing S/N-oxide reductase [Rhizobium oryzicola]MDO1582613.1 molybdopterin guanine dinucleotide-containing S/N-oxide reductase [Rhizobium oryzicola]
MKLPHGLSNSKIRTAAHWGVYEVSKSGNGDLFLAGAAEDPDPSPIGLHMASDDLKQVRIAKPSIRRSWLERGPGSNPHLRGREPFVEVEWDLALDLLAAEFKRIREKFGNEAIFGGSYGWASAGRFHHAQSQVHRFLNLIGGYVSHVDSYSLAAGKVILPHVIEGFSNLFNQHTSWDVMAKETELFVTFGGVPVKNAQISQGGPGRHRVVAGMRDMAQAGTRFVNISPVSDNMPVDSEWLSIRPNTDVALMLALAYVLETERLADLEFLATHCVGYQRFRSYLLGQTDGVPKTPAWASAICGVPMERIAVLAREMASSRTMLNVSWSLQRAVHGEQPFWMLVTLAAMLGQIGLPGGGFGLGYGAVNSVGNDNARFKFGDVPQGRNPVSTFIPVARIADMLLNPGESFTYNGKVYSYPDIRLIYWAGGNPFHHHQDLNRLLKAWEKPETIVVNEPYWTPTAKLADVLLPVTTPLERNDIAASTGEDFIVAMKKVEDPFGQSRNDFDIFDDLGRRMDIDFSEGLNEEGWLRRIYDISRENAAAKAINLPDFDEFWNAGLLDLGPEAAPVIMLESFRASPDENPVPTPSGRIEIFSETINGFSLVDCLGHPAWFEPPEWLGACDRDATTLHLISDQPPRRLHSQLDASPHSKAGKIAGREPIHIHPTDAAARGIADGDLVEVFNARGRLISAAVISDAIRPGVARLSTGAWFDMDFDSGIERHGNPNAVTMDIGASSLSQGCSAQTCLVEIRKLSARPSMLVRAFDTPQFEVSAP